jgi:ATP-dependent helicase/DNAse subunit B
MSHISYSALKEWSVCPWKHKLNYIERINEFKGNEYTAFGTALHTVCEKLVLNKVNDAAKLFNEEFVKNLAGIKEEDAQIVFKKDLIEQMRRQGAHLTQHILPAINSYFGNFELISVEEK